MPTAAELRQLLRMQYPDDFDTWLKDFAETPYPHYFALLELEPDSVTIDEDIERNWRRLINEVHPDRTPGKEAAEKAAILNRARDTLKNKHLRRGYVLFLQYLATELAEAEQQKTGTRGDTKRTASENGRYATAAPKLEIAPRQFSPTEPLAVGRTYEIRLRIRNAGDPCTPALFRVRTPRHPSHPRHSATHWLYLAQEPRGEPTSDWLEVPITVDTRHLRPEQRYSETVYVDLCGQEAACTVAFRTAARQTVTSARPVAGPSGVTVTVSSRLLLAAAAGVCALIVLAILGIRAATSGGTTTTAKQAPAPPTVAKTVAATAPAPSAAPATHTAVPATVLSSAVATQAPPTAAPSPPSTDTPAGTVLAGDQTWRQGNLELRVTPPGQGNHGELHPDSILFDYVLTNRSNTPLVLHFVHSDVFSVTDSTGAAMSYTSSESANTVDLVLKPKDSWTDWVSFKGDLTRPGVTGLTIAVNGLAGITGAQWRIPLQTNAASAAPSSGETPPGTVLNLGQVWRQGGLEVTVLPLSELHPDGILFDYRITNRTTQPFILRYTHSDVFTVSDNTGQRFTMGNTSNGNTVSYVLQPNDTQDMWIAWRGDLTRPGVTSVTITLSGVATVNNAAWRFPVQH